MNSCTYPVQSGENDVGREKSDRFDNDVIVEWIRTTTEADDQNACPNSPGRQLPDEYTMIVLDSVGDDSSEQTTPAKSNSAAFHAANAPHSASTDSARTSVETALATSLIPADCSFSAISSTSVSHFSSLYFFINFFLK